MTDEEMKDLIESVKIGTLEERLRSSAKVPLEVALETLKKQSGEPTGPNPVHQAIAYLASQKKNSSQD